MRTYRLQFSENPEILMRRFQKALASFPERLLCSGFDKFPAYLYSQASSLVWAKETSISPTQNHEVQWSEYHTIISLPEDLEKATFSEKQIIVVQPQSYKHKNKWILALKRLPQDILRDKIFIEFLPWGKEKCDLMTVREIVGFLYELKFHFKNWKPRRRPGVNLWDWRISENFELEASEFKKHQFNQQSHKPKISVIVPTFNNKYFVSNVIRHLEQQNFSKENFEVIIADDGSSDQTFEYIQLSGTMKNLQLTYLYWPRTTLRKRGDKLYRAGLSRNLGVRQARADKIVFLDSDILVPNNFVEKTLAALETYDVVQFPRYHIQQDFSTAVTDHEKISDNQIYIEEKEYWKNFFEAEKWVSLEKYWKYTCTYGLAMAKNDFYLAGRFPHFYVSYGFEDTELGYRLAELGKKFHLEPLRLLHLTSYSLSEYQYSRKKRQILLERTAKLFFLNTLEIENFHHLEGLMQGENKLIPRTKKDFDFLSKSKFFRESI